jgi:hypothetical protein
MIDLEKAERAVRDLERKLVTARARVELVKRRMVLEDERQRCAEHMNAWSIRNEAEARAHENVVRRVAEIPRELADIERQLERGRQ